MSYLPFFKIQLYIYEDTNKTLLLKTSAVFPVLMPRASGNSLVQGVSRSNSKTWKDEAASTTRAISFVQELYEEIVAQVLMPLEAQRSLLVSELCPSNHSCH